MIGIQDHVFRQLHHLRNSFAVGNVLASDQHIGDVALNCHLIKVVTKKSQQGVEMVGVGVVHNKKEDHCYKHQYWNTDGILTLVDQRQQVDQQKADDSFTPEIAFESD